jgi:hypothetical protein
VRACVRAFVRVASVTVCLCGCSACLGSIRARAIEYTRDRCRMSSIINNGDTFRGIGVESRGVFTNDKYGTRTYAGQCRDGYACGLGVATTSNGTNYYAEHGPDGQYDGRCLYRNAGGNTGYRLFERGGKVKESAHVRADGSCVYNGAACAPDDPRLLALIAQVAPVEVRPAARAPPPAIGPPLAPTQSSDGSSRPRCAPAGAREDHCHRGAPPRRTPSLVAVRHNPTINRTAAHDPIPPRSLLAELCSFGYPVRFGRPRKPWPTCRCAWRCVCALRPPSSAGYSRGTEEAATGCSRRTHGVF